MNFVSNAIYNLTVRLNNYQPFSILYLLNNNQLKERKYLMNIK